MVINPNHRYAILNSSRGSRLVETTNDYDRAIKRADYLTGENQSPMEVKDRYSRNKHGKSVVIYSTEFVPGYRGKVV